MPLFSDPRSLQIIFLSTFLVLGVLTRDWTLDLGVVGIAIATALGTQALGQALTRFLSSVPRLAPPPNPDSSSPAEANCDGEVASDFGVQFHRFHLNWRSPLITALGLSLLLRVDQGWYMALASGIAIASKFLLRFRHKHLFNPANAGIIACLSLTSGSWVSPGQWGDDGLYALLFLGTGGLILQRIGRPDTTLAFLGSYGFLEILRSLYLGWTWDVTLHRLLSGSLLVFAFFMVTDPRSIPDHSRSRVLWSMSIGVLTFILRNYFFLSTAPFWALFALAPLTLVFDQVWPSDRFQWNKPQPSSP